jgi:hypothetical protein
VRLTLIKEAGDGSPLLRAETYERDESGQLRCPITKNGSADSVKMHVAQVVTAPPPVAHARRPSDQVRPGIVRIEIRGSRRQRVQTGNLRRR